MKLGQINFFDELAETFPILSYERFDGFVIYNLHNAELSHKIAAFDYDSTLVRPKDSRPFPKDVSDWEWLYPTVPDKIKDFVSRDYTFVIFSNQSKLWKHTQIITAIETLGIPAIICIAMEKEIYKPNAKMFTSLFANSHINRKKSFFVGDALGGNNFSDCDKEFAKAINFKVFSPEDMFFQKESNINIANNIEKLIPKTIQQEMIIMVGYPGAGKSTITNVLCAREPEKYNVAEKDTLKTAAKINKAINDAISSGKSIIIDETLPTPEKRGEYITIAQKINIPVRCIHVNTSFDESYNRNKSRGEEKQVPKIVYYKYRKCFVAPDATEGFSLITIGE